MTLLCWRFYMKITLNLPDDLMQEAEIVAQSSNTNSIIIHALLELIRKSSVSESRTFELKRYKGKFDLGIDLDGLRNWAN